MNNFGFRRIQTLNEDDIDISVFPKVPISDQKFILVVLFENKESYKLSKIISNVINTSIGLPIFFCKINKILPSLRDKFSENKFSLIDSEMLSGTPKIFLYKDSELLLSYRSYEMERSEITEWYLMNV